MHNANALKLIMHNTSALKLITLTETEKELFWNSAALLEELTQKNEAEPKAEK